MGMPTETVDKCELVYADPFGWRPGPASSERTQRIAQRGAGVAGAEGGLGDLQICYGLRISEQVFSGREHGVCAGHRLPLGWLAAVQLLSYRRDCRSS
jgi:hypothetical protein